MAISFVAATSAAHTSSSSSLTLSKPAGTAEGDVLVAVVGVVDEAITNPAGWTTLESLTTAHAKGHLAYRVAGASEPTSYSWTLGQSQDDVAGSMVVIRGADVSGSPVRESAVAEDNNSTSPTSPPLAGTQASDMVVAFGSGRSSSSGPDTEITAPDAGGWTAAPGAHSGDSDPGGFPQSTDAAYQINGGTATFSANANVNTVMFAVSLISGGDTVNGNLAATAPAGDADAAGGVTAIGDLEGMAPAAARADVEGDLTITGTAGLPASGAQAGITGSVTIGSTIDATAPLSRVVADGLATTDVLRARGPSPQVQASGEVTYAATLAADAPAARAGVTAALLLPGVLALAAPAAQADTVAEATTGGDLTASVLGARADGAAVVTAVGPLTPEAPAAQLDGAGESDQESALTITAPAAQVAVSMANFGEPEVSYVIAAEERETVVQPDIPRETYYV